MPFGGREARGTIEIEDEPPMLGEPLLETHRRFAARLRGHEARVRDHVAWRDRWYDEDKHPALLTAKEPRAAIGLSWFDVYDDGGGQLCYGSGRTAARCARHS